MDASGHEKCELLREIRNEIGKIEIRGNDGYRVRAEAITILINAEWRIRGEQQSDDS